MKNVQIQTRKNFVFEHFSRSVNDRNQVEFQKDQMERF